MKPRVIISVIILAVAILAFGGLAYQTVPISTAQTITKSSTSLVVEYFTSLVPYRTRDLITITFWTDETTWMDWDLYCFCPDQYCVPGCVWTDSTTDYSGSISTMNYQVTMTNSITEISTNTVPAYATLGLTDVSFGALAILVIGVLVLIAILSSLKITLRQKPRQATLTNRHPEKLQDSKAVQTQAAAIEPVRQAVAPSTTSERKYCRYCGAKIPRTSKFCEECGRDVKPV